MKLLIIDSYSMIGHVIRIYMEEHGHDVYGYDERKSECSRDYTGKMDDYEQIKKLIVDGGYDAVINAAAVINEDAEDDKIRAVNINVLLPRFLEEVTRGTKTVVVHRSTDCIFSGEKGQYTLDDWPEGDTFYARSKALGELNNDKDISLRVSLIGPETSEDGTGLFNWYYNQTGEVGGFVSTIWTGVTTVEFARQIEWFLKNDVHGLYQTVPKKSINKHDLITLFEKYYPADRTIKRIENKHLDRSLVQMKPDGLEIPLYEEMISDMRHWTDNHRDIYRYN